MLAKFTTYRMVAINRFKTPMGRDGEVIPLQQARKDARRWS